jgi:hypothetical protein
VIEGLDVKRLIKSEVHKVYASRAFQAGSPPVQLLIWLFREADSARRTIDLDKAPTGGRL